MYLRRVARLCAWTIAGGVFLVIALYGTLVAINWSDEAPSPDALRLERAVVERPVVADADNGYVLLLGLAAPLDQDPLEVGRKREQFLEHFSAPASADFVPFPDKDFDYRPLRSEATRRLADACMDGHQACLQAIRNDPGEVSRWLASEAWLLDRYHRLLACSQWAETIPTDSRAPLPLFQHALHAQTLLLMQAWQAAHAGDPETARALLQEDAAFWRMALGSSDLLITKMIATVAVDRHFDLGNLVLREAQGAGRHVDPPAAWLSPISRQERSIQRALAGEMRYFALSMESPDRLDVAEVPGGDSWAARQLGRLLFKPQATRNLYASYFVHVANRLDVDYRRVPQARRALSSEFGPDDRAFRAYNPVGYAIYRNSAVNAYTDYALRVSDLEGARRAALLAVELRNRTPDVARPLCEMQETTLRNPYTGQSFDWDCATRSIVFQGLGSWPRARHSVLL
jgi:hypothetical protein